MDDLEYNELIKKYKDTYISIVNDGKPTPLFVSGFNKIEDDVYVVGKLPSKKVIIHLDDKVKLTAPKTGLFNFHGSVMIGERFPDRQWKKGLCKANFSVRNPLQNIFDGIIGQYDGLEYKTFTWSINDLSHLYNRVFFSINRAIELVSNGNRIASAINREFFVSASHYNKSVLLWRIDIPVAELFDGEVKILVPEFKQEVEDLFNRSENG